LTLLERDEKNTNTLYRRWDSWCLRSNMAVVTVSMYEREVERRYTCVHMHTSTSTCVNEFTQIRVA